MRVKKIGEVLKALKPFLKDYLKEHEIDTSKHFLCLSPEHNDTIPSCHIIPGAEDDMRAYCNGCGKSFDILDACSILEDKPKEGKGWITDTVAYLAKKYSIEMRIEDITEDDIYEIDTYRAYATAAKLLTHKMPVGSLGERELQKRGWKEDTLQQFSLGMVLDYEAFIDELKKDFSAKFLREVDLARKDLFNPDHLIFTWKDEYGRPVGFTGRNLRFEEEKAAGDKTKSKYRNTRTTGLKCSIFKKNSRLFGIDTAIKATPPLWIFEGQADVITCKQAGLLNCVCFAGGDLSSDQVYLIKKLGIYEVILCPDGDEAGRDKLEKIVKNILPGHKELSVKIALLPEEEDPDSFIRQNGINSFLSLPTLDVFEWRLSQFSEDDDPVDISRKMVQLIALEPSPIRRDACCRLLASRVDVSLKAIQDELNIRLDEKAYVVAREREGLIEKLTHELRSDPTKAEEILRAGYSDIVSINIKHNCSVYSVEEFSRVVRELKTKDEEKGDKFEGFFLGPDLEPLEKALEGDWTRDVMLCIGGKENTGKTALLCKLGMSIAEKNDDTTVIFHSIDDTLAKFLPRLICLADGNRILQQNYITSPHFWANQPDVPLDLIQRRDLAYQKVLSLVSDGRLVGKDINNGQSQAFVEGLLAYYAENGKKIVYFLDNFHKLDWFPHMKDERSKWRKTSDEMKKLAERYHVAIICSVEYHKMAPGTKPSNYNIGESAQLSYDANFTLHLYSELNDLPDKYTICHREEGNIIHLPRLECIIGKNKVGSNKDTFYLDFWPAHSEYRWVSKETMRQEAEQVAVELGRSKAGATDDPFKGKGNY